MEENSRMVVLNMDIYILIVISVLIVGVFSLGINFSILLRERKRYRSNPFAKQGYTRPYILDEVLLLDKTPFAWRVGFTLSMLNYSPQQIDEFLEALGVVLKEESKFFELMENHKNKGFRNYLKLSSKKETNRVKEFSDLLTSHSIMNAADPKRSLDVILYSSIYKFIEDKAWKARLKREDMSPPGEAPF
jgi:hypothetical protein